MLTHLGCLGSTFECPRCSKTPLEVFDHVKHGGLCRQKFQKGTVPGARDVEKATDVRVPCSVTEHPTDEEAKKNGFKYAKEWYLYSTSGALAESRMAKEFDKLPKLDSKGKSEVSADAQWWNYLQDPTDALEFPVKQCPAHVEH